MTDFETKVKEIVKSIPKGRVATYSAIAKLAGRPKAARAVGTILKNNRCKTIPCHRIVRADSSLGGYNGLRGVGKSSLLMEEGVSMVNGFVNLRKYQWIMN